MRLKLLKFKNFKSFKNAEIIFNSNLNVILGPNGSGKSNICDGLKFVLGERSLTSLRVKSSKELIHGNSDYAEVLAVFEYDGTELILEREIKDDKNVYKVNSKKVTYEEYMEELLKLNLGNSYRFFIMQGQVEKIIGLNKNEKMQLLYDGAGIQQFEIRKSEILEEMKTIDERISQLSLLIGEKMKFLDELKVESERASNYINIKNRLEILRNTLAYIDYTRISKNIETIKIKLQELLNTKTELEQKLEQLRSQIETINREREAILNEFRSKEMSKILIDLTEQQENLQKRRAELMDKQRLLFERNKMYQNLLTKRQEIIERIGWLKNKVKDIDMGNIQQNLDRLKSINQELIEVEAELMNLNVKYREFADMLKNVNIEQLKLELARLNNEILNVYRQDRELSDQIKTIEEEIRKLEKEKELNQIQSNILILENFIKELKDRVVGIHDMVINLISFDPKLKNAVDAFGTRLLNIVVDDVDVAKKINEILKNSNIRLGRISIIPLAQLNVPNYKNVNIGLGLLKNHIQTESRFEKVLDYVFGDVVLMKSFDEAKIHIGKYRMVTLDGEMFEPTGVITIGSSNLSISSARLYSEIVKKIDELKSKKDSLSVKREELAHKIAELRERKAALDSKLSVFSNNPSFEDLSKIEDRIKELTKRKEELNKIKESLEKDIAIYQDKIKDIEEIAAFKKEIELKQRELEEIDKNIIDLDQEIRELNINIRSMSDQIRIEELAIAQKRRQYFEMDQKIKEKIEESKHKEEMLKNLGYEQQKISEQLANVEKSYYRYERELSNMEIELKNIAYRQDIGIIQGDREQIEAEISELESNLLSLGNINFRAKEMYDALSKDIGEIDQKIEKLREERIQLVNMLNEVEAKKALFFKDFIKRVDNRFRELTKTISGLGEGIIELVDDNIDIVLIRDNKKIRLESLSGGEKSLLGLLLIFAMNQENPLPITVFDEVDAALDKMNKDRLKNFILLNSEKTQFIIVTHSQDLAKIGKNIIGVSKVGDSSRIAQISI